MDDEKNSNKPLMDGCYDNWTWSKRHRSQEVVFTDSKMRKGKHFLANRPFYIEILLHLCHSSICSTFQLIFIQTGVKVLQRFAEHMRLIMDDIIGKYTCLIVFSAQGIYLL